jgi:hypothetical protein
MLETPPASEKKLDLTEEMFGAFSEFINLRRLSNSYSAPQTNLGKNLTK